MKQNKNIKKVLALIIAASMMTAFVACGDDEQKNDNNSDTNNTQSSQIETSAEDNTTSIVEFDDEDTEENITTVTTTMTTTKKTTTTTAAPKRDNTYKVKAVEFKSEDGNIDISYPQISGLYDENMQNYYNKLFKSDFADYMGERTNNDSLSCKYQVTYKTKDLLSIVFRCVSNLEGSAHPFAYAYAYTIDLETGGTLVPSAVTDKDNAVKNFKSGEGWTLTRSSDGVGKSDIIEYYNDTDVEQIKEYITETDVFTVTRNKKGKYSVSGTVACRSYLDGSAAPIFILDVTHALGDYVEVEFH